MKYELLDCGNGRKLEQFGDIIADRPAPQADWLNKLPLGIWDKALLLFNNGWDIRCEIPASWTVEFEGLKFRLEPSPSGQLGIFPEQFDNWLWISNAIKTAGRPLNILNCFAYTGAATLFALNAGAQVCHVDAAKSSINRAKENAAISGLADKPVRWITDDVLTFMTREIKRGKKYDGFILDPPAFGRLKGNHAWSLNKNLPELIGLTKELMSEQPEFIVLSCHAPDLSLKDLAHSLSFINIINSKEVEKSEMTLISSGGMNLPAGKTVRWKNSL